MMQNVLESIPETDPLAIPQQRAMIDQILADNKDVAGAVMVVLNELQTHIGYISVPMQAYVARKLRVPMSQINGVVSFYSFFTTRPRGKHTIKFCLGTACYVRGSPQLIDKTRQSLGINIGETTEDGEISLEVCRCLGACSQAPVIVVDDAVRGRMIANQMPQVIHTCQGNGHKNGS
jgi:NADH-quinone oxidoreductase subunit E